MSFQFLIIKSNTLGLILENVLKFLLKCVHQSSKRKSNFTGAEVEVLLQDVDVSILFHYGYINTIEFSAYLFIHLHLQCSCRVVLLFIL